MVGEAGGFTTRDGRRVLVTPEGEIVGTSVLAGGGSGGGSFDAGDTNQARATQTEIELQQSLPADLRNLPAEQVRASISREQRFIASQRREGKREVGFKRAVQTKQPARFGQSLSRKGIQEARQQSLPREVVGGSVEFEFQERQPTTRIERLSVSSGFGREVVIQAGFVPFGATPQEIERARQSAVLRDISLVSTGFRIKPPSVQIVAFKGVTQQIGRRGIITDIKFRTSLGKVGEATGRTEVLFEGGRLSLGKTVVGGATGRRVVGFEKVGEVGTIPESVFLVGGKSIGVNIGKATVQRTSGRVASQDIQRFESLDIGIREGRKTFISGVTTFERGGAIASAGVTTPKVPRISKAKIDTIRFGKSLDEQFMGGTQRLRIIDKKGRFAEIKIPKSDLGNILSQARIETEAGVRAGVGATTPRILIPSSKVSLGVFGTAQTIQTISSQPLRFPPTQTIKTLSTTFQPSTSRQQITIVQGISPRQRVGTRAISSQRIDTGLKSIQTPKITTSLRELTGQKSLITPKLITVSRGRGIGGRTFVPRITTPPPIIPIKFPTFKPTPTLKGTGGFGVSIRRRGTFRSIGSGLSLGKAFSIGTRRVGTTLGATFKITSPSGKTITGLKTPKGFRRKNGLFIETRGLRLSTKGETSEIQTARLKI